jgi:prolipoprotein diacylglyceryltransferase
MFWASGIFRMHCLHIRWLRTELLSIFKFTVSYFGVLFIVGFQKACLFSYVQFRGKIRAYYTYLSDYMLMRVEISARLRIGLHTLFLSYRGIRTGSLV